MIWLGIAFSYSCIPQEVAADFSILGANESRQIHFALDNRLKVVAQGAISDDGTTYFPAVVPQPVVNLTSGKTIYIENIRIGVNRETQNRMVGTQWQWGFFKSQRQELYRKFDFLGSTIVRCAKNDHEWLSGDGQNMVLIDTRKQGNSPNSKVKLTPRVLADGGQIGIAERFDSAGHGILLSMHRASKDRVEVHKFVASWGQKFTSHSIIASAPLPPKAAYRNDAGRLPEDFDEGRSTFLYSPDRVGKPPFGNYKEWLSREKRWRTLPDIMSGSYFYFAGELLAAQPGSGGAALSLCSTDGKKCSKIGPYEWIARSSNEKHLLVRKTTDNTYWLISFK
ncbi:MAG: hypothetical protein U0R49_04820 [Fimbriimonadales bacterium]